MSLLISKINRISIPHTPHIHPAFATQVRLSAAQIRVSLYPASSTSTPLRCLTTTPSLLRPSQITSTSPQTTLSSDIQGTLQHQLVKASEKIKKWDDMVEAFGGEDALSKLPVGHQCFKVKSSGPGSCYKYITFNLPDLGSNQIGMRVPDTWDSNQRHNSMKWLNRRLIVRRGDLHTTLNEWARLGDSSPDVFSTYEAPESLNLVTTSHRPKLNSTSTALQGEESPSGVRTRVFADSVAQQVERAEVRGKLQVWLDAEAEYRKLGGYTEKLPLRNGSFKCGTSPRRGPDGIDLTPYRYLSLTFWSGQGKCTNGIQLPSHWDEAELKLALDWLNKRLVVVQDVRTALYDWAGLADLVKNPFSMLRDNNAVAKK